MRQLNLHFFKKGPSVTDLLNHVPEDGCLLVFNGRHNTWRAKCSDLGIYLGRSMSCHKVSEVERPVYCDMYITIT